MAKPTFYMKSELMEPESWKNSVPLTTSTIQFSIITGCWRHTHRRPTLRVRVSLDRMNAQFQAPAYHRNSQPHVQWCTFVRIIFEKSIFSKPQTIEALRKFVAGTPNREKTDEQRKKKKNYTRNLGVFFWFKFNAALRFSKN